MDQILIAVFLLLALFALFAAGLWIGLGLVSFGGVGLALFTTRPLGDALVTTLRGRAEEGRVGADGFRKLKPRRSAYDVRIIDWSSDVCSSDLIARTE